MTPNEYQQAIQQKIQTATPEQITTIATLVEILCHDETDQAKLETAYAYYTGKANWQTDAQQLL